MAGRLGIAIELALDGGDVDDVFVAGGGAEHEGLEAGVKDEGRDGVDELDFEEFDRGDFVEEEAPGVAAAEVDLLKVLVEAAFGKEVLLAEEFFGQERDLGEFSGGGGLEFRAAEELVGRGGHLGEGGAFAFHHVGVEFGGAADGLAGVIDDEVEVGARREEFAAEGFDAGGVAEVEAEDFEAMAPDGEVWFLGVAVGGIAGEAGGDDELRAGAEELEAGLVADFDASAGEEGDAAMEVGEFGALDEVVLGAGGAHLVVEVVDDGELLLADVAVLGFDGLAGFGFVGVDVLRREAGGGEDVGGGEDGLAAEGADAGIFAGGVDALGFGFTAFALLGFQAGAAGDGVGVEVLGDEVLETAALGLGEVREEVAVGV